MTPQEIFDYVLTFMRKQARPAFRNMACKYETTGLDDTGNAVTLKCAAGCLFPEGFYCPGMDDINGEEGGGYQFSNLLITFDNLAWPQWMKENVPLINSLQSCHDINADLFMVPGQNQWLESFEDQMRSVAVKYGLSWKYSPPKRPASLGG